MTDAKDQDLLPGGGTLALWRRQVIAILRLELRRYLFSKRAFGSYIFAALPIGFCALLLVVRAAIGKDVDMEVSGDPYTSFYFGFVLMIVTFVGCFFTFMNLFRGEVLSRSLHYYFLAPVRRDVLVVGKYLSGLAATTIVFGLSTLLSFALLQYSVRLATATTFLLSGEALRQAFGFLFVTALGCLGYGSVAMTLGLLFRNPVVPGLVVWLWETFNFMLPPLLKKISIVHYLRSAAPLPVTDGAFAIVAEPTPLWLAVPGMLLVTLVALAIAAWRVRRMEIIYGS